MTHAWGNKKLFRLGKTITEAYATWSARIGTDHSKVKTISQLFEKYLIECVPLKSPRTRSEYERYIKNLTEVFGEMMIDDIEPTHIYKYVSDRSKKTISTINGQDITVGGPSIARREKAVFSHAMTKAVEWGIIKIHPFKDNVRLEGEKPRTRYIEDWEIIECLNLKSIQKRGSVVAIQAYMRLKLLTGLRQGDLLRLQEKNIKRDGIHVTPNKTKNTTGKAVIYTWSDELREAIRMARAARPNKESEFLFCNRFGDGYVNEDKGTAEGWATMWQNFMARVMAETKVVTRFTEHDLRAKCASDASSLEHARQLLAHSDSKTTNRVYRRKAERVNPLK